ncbi:alpha-amylase family protein [Dyadobacter sandarakinus]|uniref:Alpha-amylase family protein n=1 Tax=Dyadobacter sandarakinus TaxID=2747268 RepID=A0ABX7I473_9BACT|nr:alpha-amylase family protein [Dyadobacter sandarakinus]QRR00312.1 alpha-amylase family protein [Dyadobacter sandarakinus]
MTRNRLLTGLMMLPAWCQAQVAPREIKENFWYKNSIIYNLEVGVFKDSDGDGKGDFNGLIDKLDYLKMLGVDAIWLAPFQPSPGQDDGYDVADFYGVDPRLGTSGDFAEFMHQAQKRGIRVIMDLVINHTSDQHPWFRDARTSKTSKYRDWYVWSAQRPKNADKGMVFPGIEKEVWTLDKQTNEYFYHRFYTFQPDLNYSNPAVMRESQRIIGYWLNQGIAGFRLDAVPFIIEVPKSNIDKPELDFDFLTDMRQFVQSRKADATILGEANVEPSENGRYFGKRGEGIQMMFNFFANQHLFYALATGELEPLKSALLQTKEIPDASQWANFLRNHDEIDLGRLTDKQRQQVYDKFGPDKNMQLYDRGIRRRLAPMLSNNRKHIDLAYSLLFSLPGAPVIRYGEELGMGDDLSLKERLSVRTPMQWNGSANAGFTTADTAFRPVINSGPFGFQQVNVEKEYRDPASLLNWITMLIRLRKSAPEIGLGSYTLLNCKAPSVLGIRYDYEGQSVVVLHNLSDKPAKATFTLDKADKLYDMINPAQDQTTPKGKADIALEGYGFKWYRINRVLP